MTDETELNETQTKQHYPIWKFQWLFQSQVARKAEEVFGLLDGKLDPKLFLLGIPVKGESEPSAICLQPADDCGYSPEFFSGVMTLAKEIDLEIAASDPFRKPPPEKISDSSIQIAVERILSEQIENSGIVSYCSMPTIVGNYKVCCVLQLDARAYNSHYSLDVKIVGKFRLPKSLVDSAAVEFLAACSKALRERDAGLDLDALGREPEEILRAAGRELTFRAGNAGHGPMPGLFDALNILSSKNYEGERASGELLIITPDHPDLTRQIQFKEGIELNDHGAARKVLEMASGKNFSENEEKLYLLSTGHEIYGIGKLKEDYNRRYSEVFVVRFTGHYSWELTHDGNTMMKVRYGQPSLPENRLDEKKFKDHVVRLFIKETPNTEKLWEIVTNASEQNHGTMIVISSAAQSEAERLAGQSTLIKPATVTKENLLMLTSIDGAVLVDPKGVCHAVGVILDGKAVAGKGTRARGARYNSAIRYIDSAEKESECLAVVISEDGMINLVPDLMPKIHRAQIEENLNLLRGAIAGETVESKKYYKALDWFQIYRFYLSEETCRQINEIKNEMREKLLKQEGFSKTPKDFTVDEEMNESYFWD